MIDSSGKTETRHLVLEALHSSSAVRNLFPLRAAVVLYIDIIGFSRFEQTNGPVACTHVVEVLARTLEDHAAIVCGVHGRGLVLHVWDDGFVLLLPWEMETSTLRSTIHALVAAAERSLNESLQPWGFDTLRLRYGISMPTAVAFSETRFIDGLYAQMTEAGRMARRSSLLPPGPVIELFHRMMADEDVHVRYQPVVDLTSGEPVGWECLARGPEDSELFHPLRMFECAEQLGCVTDLERLCRRRAISGATLPADALLFINVHPSTFSDPTFREGETLRLADRHGLRPAQIVFEITEHEAVHDYARFNHLISHYRAQGYKVAIDDTGAGYSGLVTLMEIKPDFVKVDMGLVRGIAQDETKQSIVRAIGQVSQTFGAVVVAEGIETIEDLRTVQQCGVWCGQGYLLGLPERACQQPALPRHMY